MSPSTVLLFVLVVLLVLALPSWPHSRSRSGGYYPSGGLGLVLVVVLLLLVPGVLLIITRDTRRSVQRVRSTAGTCYICFPHLCGHRPSS
jgi:Protein of unknown function (DUF3309)